jgi:hypothetical protein
VFLVDHADKTRIAVFRARKQCELERDRLNEILKGKQLLECVEGLE